MVLQSARQAAVWAPLDSSNRYLEAKVLQAMGQGEEAFLVFGRVLQLRPINALYLQRAAGAAQDLDRRALAGSLFKSGTVLDRADPRRSKPYARWLIRQQQEEQAFVEIKRALELDPRQTRSFVDLMLLNGVPSIMMAQALPESAYAWLAYAHYLVEVKRFSAAERAFRKAMLLMPKEERPTYRAHWAYYKFLAKRERFEEAVAVIQKGIELFPDHVGLHSTAGRLYERQQINYRAIEEYRQALLLNPKLEWVRKRLERLEGGRL